jgi:hypothetical protein
LAILGGIKQQPRELKGTGMHLFDFLHLVLIRKRSGFSGLAACAAAASSGVGSKYESGSVAPVLQQGVYIHFYRTHSERMAVNTPRSPSQTMFLI